MLETARRQGASIFVYLIFCLLIAIFVINFGPQRGQGGGCDSSSNVVLGVDGVEVSQSAWHVAYSNGYNRGAGKQKTYVALETLIRRELLAQEAEARGLRVDSDLIQDEIKRGRFFIGGQRASIPGIFDEEGFWSFKAFKSWHGSMNVSRNSYVSEQQRSMLATLMAQTLTDAITVSREEALAHYLFENDTVQYDVVAFKPEPYRASMKLTDADVARFLAAHGAEVEARYKADERTYKGVKPQLELHQIFVATAAQTPPPVAPGGAGAGSAAAQGSGAGPAQPAAPGAGPDTGAKPGASREQATAKLEAARAAIESGKLTFAAAAAQLSSDTATKAESSELGWRTADSAMLGDKAVTDAVKTLQAGKLTPVIATDRGVYLLWAAARREGDLAYDQVKLDIARDMAKDVWSKEAAKRAALAALDKARSGTGLNLDQMYEKASSPEQGPGIDIQQILKDPKLTPEQKQQLLQMLLQQGQKSGALVWESEDVPASWRAQADGAGGAAPPPVTGAASPPPAPGPAAAAAGSGSGAAAPAPAAGAGSGAPVMPAAATSPAAPVPPAAELTPSSDTLPTFDTVEPPTVTRFGPAPRSMSMAGLGTSKEAAAALFGELSPGMLARRVYEADGGYVVVQLIAHSAPKVEDFEKDADRLLGELRAKRAQDFLDGWLEERCEKLAKDGKITPNAGLVQEFDDAGKRLPVTYRPCMSFSSR